MLTYLKNYVKTMKPETALGWLFWILPGWLMPYAALIRLDRGIGTWLLLIPCWWGLTLAAGRGHWPDAWLLFLFAVGADVMRGAGCIVNDIYDRKLDAQVERTRNRPLASGAIKVWQAIVFLCVLLFIGFCILLFLNLFTIKLAMLSLLLVFTYPWMKRITFWPQLFLGFTFNWGALLGWSSVKDNLEWPALLLYAAGIFWTLGYDTIYAHQDKRDDEKVGIKSTALLFGDKSLPIVTIFYALTIGLLALSGLTAGLGYSFYAVLAAAAVYAFVELAQWKLDEPENCLLRFRRNRNFGLIVSAGIVLGQFL